MGTKKAVIQTKGETAAQKLLIPNLIMFVGIMIVVVIPLIASMFGSLSAV